MSSSRKYLKAHSLNRCKDKFRMRNTSMLKKTTKVYTVPPMKLPSSEIIFVSGYVRNEKFRTQRHQVRYTSLFGRPLKKSLTCYYLMEDRMEAF